MNGQREREIKIPNLQWPYWLFILRLFIYCAAIAVDSGNMTALSSASWSRFSPPWNSVNGHVSTMWFMVNVVHGSCGSWFTGRWLGETPFMQVSTTWASTCPETVHQRPCMTREVEPWLSDSRVSNSSVVDHRSWRLVLSPLRNCVDRCHVWPDWWAAKTSFLN